MRERVQVSGLPPGVPPPPPGRPALPARPAPPEVLRGNRTDATMEISPSEGKV